MHTRCRNRVQHHAQRFTHIGHIAVVRQRQCGQGVDIGGVVLAKVGPADGPVLAHQFPDGALHFTVGDAGVGAGEVIHQPIDRIQIRNIATGVAQVRQGRLQNAKLGAGVDAGGVGAWHIDIDPGVNTPTVIDRARRREQRVVHRGRRDSDVEQAGLKLDARVGNADRDGRGLIHRRTPKVPGAGARHCTPDSGDFGMPAVPTAACCWFT